MQAPAHILVIRFSSMGDVAMTVPVLRNLLEQNPQLQITVVSNAVFQPLFEGLERCHFHPAFLREQHKGIAGIYRLYKELKLLIAFDAVADLHNVLRSQILGTLFRVSGRKVSKLNKGRDEKKQLTRKTDKECRQLTSMHERYAEMFRKLGLPVSLRAEDAAYEKMQLPVSVAHLFTTGKKQIGIAPFAQYREKMYPLEKMKVIVSHLVDENYSILLFGGRGEEAAVLQQWEDEFASLHNVAGKYSFKEELAIISNLDIMVSMDSANMHLASLFKVPVVSIWGATHHYAGFYGWGQEIKNIVEIDLYCRPCSVFGNIPCYRGDHACMHRIEESMVLQKIADISNI
ncbi:MAG: glycosyltransferase family 9 protein [Ferruginibacter sp.]